MSIQFAYRKLFWRNYLNIERIEAGERYSRVVMHNGVAYFMGHVADDKRADIETQTRQVLTRLDQSLALAGSDRIRLLSVTIWLADVTDYEKMNRIWDEWIPDGAAPARSTIGARPISAGRRIVLSAIAAC
jgi:enamine deaminase RidA (YjgF/YER057c/UK114 family)